MKTLAAHRRYNRVHKKRLRAQNKARYLARKTWWAAFKREL